MSKTVKVAVTGTAGQIGYSILPRIASGEVFGQDTRVILHLYDIPAGLKALEGVVMELEDCAYPTLAGVVITDDTDVAFDGVNWAVLIGSKPRTKGMERSDLIKENGPIFTGQGRSMQRAASDVRIIVVGNPANTNCLIAIANAKDIPADRFAALTRLDQNRAMAQLAKKTGVSAGDVTNMAIWGNHSTTMYPDVENAKISGSPAMDVINDEEWVKGTFMDVIQKRGAKIIEARGVSSAASAANATLDHIKSVEAVTPAGDWFSAAIPSDGSYGIEPGIVYSFPVVSDGHGLAIVQGLPISDYSRGMMDASLDELRKEREVVKDLLG